MGTLYHNRNCNSTSKTNRLQTSAWKPVRISLTIIVSNVICKIKPIRTKYPTCSFIFVIIIILQVIITSRWDISSDVKRYHDCVGVGGHVSWGWGMGLSIHHTSIVSFNPQNEGPIELNGNVNEQCDIDRFCKG